jgi:nucleotide-binding universal stress UspA family protein
MFQKILVAYDGSEGSKKALRAGIQLAKRLEVDLYSISVEEGLPYYAATVGEVEELKDDADTFFKKITKEAWDEAALEGVNLHATVLPGHEVETIITFAKEGRFDLLIIGFVGYSNVFGRIMGSTSQNLTRLAPCSVLVAK